MRKMFNTKKKTIKRKDIPKESLWIYDNYDELIKNIDPTLVTEAIWDKNKSDWLKCVIQGDK